MSVDRGRYMQESGRPPEDPVDRKEEVGRIVGAMTNPNLNANYALVGGRRMGKSTILRRVRGVLDAEGGVIVGYVDFEAVRHSPAGFAEVLARSLTESYSRTLPGGSQTAVSAASVLSQIREIQKLRARFAVSMGPSGVPAVEIDPYKGAAREHEKSFLGVFDYANRLSDVSGKRVLIIIDGFGHLVNYDRVDGLGGIFGIFKTVVENRTNVSFVVSGSGMRDLRGILEDGRNPLFGHFVVIDVVPLEKEHAMELFERSGSHPAGRRAAGDAFEAVGGHPFYLVMLAEGRRRGEPVRDAYVRLLTAPTAAMHLYVNYMVTEDLGSAYKNTNHHAILVSLARGPKSPSEISRDARIRVTDLPRLMRTLAECGVVKKSGGKYSISDKVVRDFFYHTGPE